MRGSTRPSEEDREREINDHARRIARMTAQEHEATAIDLLAASRAYGPSPERSDLLAAAQVHVGLALLSQQRQQHRGPHDVIGR